MAVQVFGEPSARRSTEVQSNVHSLWVKRVLAQVHGQFHQPPEVRSIRWGVGVDGGLRFAERHQEMPIGVRVPIQEHHAAGIAVDDLLFSITVWVRPVVREEVGAAGRWRCLGGVDLRFKGTDIGHSPGCPKGRVHDPSVGREILRIMKLYFLRFDVIQRDPLWMWMTHVGSEGRFVRTIFIPASLLTPHARSTSARVAFSDYKFPASRNPVDVQEERRGTVTASIPKNIFGGIRGEC